MNNHLPTIHQLRKSGYKVRINHKRYYAKYGLFSKKEAEEMVLNQYWGDCKNKINPKGGYTAIEITTPTGENFKSEAACSKKDSFNRKIALRICLGRISKSHTFQIKE